MATKGAGVITRQRPVATTADDEAADAGEEHGRKDKGQKTQSSAAGASSLPVNFGQGNGTAGGDGGDGGEVIGGVKNDDEV